MKKIDLNEKLRLLSEVCEILNKSRITYLVYGSMAFNFLTGQNIEVNDIDIVVMQKDFEMSYIALFNSPLKLIPQKGQGSIVAKSTEYSNAEDKPFEVAMVSDQQFFGPMEIDFFGGTEVNVNDILVRVISKEDLIKTYQLCLQSPYKKLVEDCQKKLNTLHQTP